MTMWRGLIIKAVKTPSVCTFVAMTDNSVSQLQIPLRAFPMFFIPPIARGETGPLPREHTFGRPCWSFHAEATQSRANHWRRFVRRGQQFPGKRLEMKCIRPMRIFQYRPPDPLRAEQSGQTRQGFV